MNPLQIGYNFDGFSGEVVKIMVDIDENELHKMNVRPQMPESLWSLFPGVLAPALKCSCRHSGLKSQRMFSTKDLDSVGFGVPAVIGARLADRGRRTVFVCENDGLQINI